jgi:hypothetical protein
MDYSLSSHKSEVPPRTVELPDGRIVFQLPDGRFIDGLGIEVDVPTASANGTAAPPTSSPEGVSGIQCEEAGSTLPPPAEPLPVVLPTTEDIITFAAPPVEGSGVELSGIPALDELVHLSQEYRHLEGKVDHIYFSLAVLVSSAINPCSRDPMGHFVKGEEPLWGFLVDPSSGGKGEDISMCDGVLDEQVDNLTLAGLFTNTAKPNQPVKVSGLLARHYQQNFTVAIKDLSTMLTDPKKSGSQKDDLYAALRKVYDGEYTREMQGTHIGWQGRMTLLAGVTPAIDRFSSYMDHLGSRQLYCRFPEADVNTRVKFARKAVDRTGTAAARKAAQDQTTNIINAAQACVSNVELSEAMSDLISRCSVITGFGRSPVQREHWARYEVSADISSELPGRVAHELKLLAASLLALGLPEPHVARIVRDTALDSMPAERCKVLRVVASSPEPVTPYKVRKESRLEYRAVERTLDDWRAIGLVSKAKIEQVIEDEEQRFVYSLSEDGLELMGSLFGGEAA